MNKQELITTQMGRFDEFGKCQSKSEKGYNKR